MNVSRDSRGVDHLDDILRDALLCWCVVVGRHSWRSGPSLSSKRRGRSDYRPLIQPTDRLTKADRALISRGGVAVCSRFFVFFPHRARPMSCLLTINGYPKDWANDQTTRPSNGTAAMSNRPKCKSTSRRPLRSADERNGDRRKRRRSRQRLHPRNANPVTPRPKQPTGDGALAHHRRAASSWHPIFPVLECLPEAVPRFVRAVHLSISHFFLPPPYFFISAFLLAFLKRATVGTMADVIFSPLSRQNRLIVPDRWIAFVGLFYWFSSIVFAGFPPRSESTQLGTRDGPSWNYFQDEVSFILNRYAHTWAMSMLKIASVKT